MSVQEAAATNAGLDNESESEPRTQQPTLTEDEGTFKGPTFYPPVYRRRYAAVFELAKKHQAKKILDFGCAEAKLVKFLISQETLPHMEELVGVDINRELLEENMFRIKPLISDYLRPRSHPFKVSLYQGSVAEADERFVDFDLVACIELIEHLEPDVLDSMPEAVFGLLCPKVVIVTTPNVEFNVLFPNLEGFRHYDHKFEWTRAEFQEWSNNQAREYNYSVTFDGIAPGPEGTEHLGCCSQVAVFERISSSATSSDVYKMHEPYDLVAEVDYPYREDKRTEEDKILQEVEYILWFLSTKKEEEECGMEGPDDKFTPTDDHDVFDHIGEEQSSDCTTKTEDDEDSEACIYSLDKLLSFSSLCKICDSIQKLKDVLQTSPLFQLTEDGLGVLWHQPTQHWSSDESDTGWDGCGGDERSGEYNRESAWEEPENWDGDDDGASDGYTASNTEVCWDDSNDWCKLWNDKDWSEYEEGRVEEHEDEDEDYSRNILYQNSLTVAQESDGSLNNESDDNMDSLVWISCGT